MSWNNHHLDMSQGAAALPHRVSEVAAEGRVVHPGVLAGAAADPPP